MDKKNKGENFQINLNPNEVKILYTDMIHMNTNEDGVTFDICQKVGATNQLQVVSRIGMSRNHAKKFVKKLSELLALTEGQSRPLANVAKLINTLSAYYVSFVEIARLPNEPVYVVVTGSGEEAIIADASDFAAPVASLQFILTNIKMGESKPVKIDLRFDKPVLTY